MLSTHIDPFVAFCKDLQIPGCEVHLYKGPNAFGMILDDHSLPQQLNWWDTENVYFLAGVRKGMNKRAADNDVMQRSMFTLDFDIRKELEKEGQGSEVGVKVRAEHIIAILSNHNFWKDFRYAVLSGNGLHVHYFGQPVTVVKDFWVAGMKDIFEEIAKLTPIPPDHGCGNAGRIMRMPGSWNVKDPNNKKPVDIVVWQPSATLGHMRFVEVRGELVLRNKEKIRQAELKEFETRHPSGESPVIDCINQIPIEQVVAQLFAGVSVRAVKKDGGLRFADEKGLERGFFKHHSYNIIVHEGTCLFPPPSGKGYNCLGLVKIVLQKTTPEAVDWFADRMEIIRQKRNSEKAAWAAENNRVEILNFTDSLSHISHV